ncbi:MAG: hypothetical protein M3416_08670 [Acidobacteriota bacterium]|nr:hypothetical protein [Acidobacteriota bacterium]
MNAAAREMPGFVRRTHLRADEYHTNFRKLDCETISRLTSEEASRVSSQVCKVYLSLVNAPAGCWERDGVLRFAGEERGGEWVTAWEQLVSLVGVASATARKALLWMHEEGIIGYYAGKNGAGIRVFLNRAASSVGRRTQPGQKILRLVHASPNEHRASSADTPFRDSFADSEVLETDLSPCAPKNGAGTNGEVKPPSAPARPSAPSAVPPTASAEAVGETARSISTEEIVSRLVRELEPPMRAAAAQAAAREHERTREWLESRGLPKAARVAQREAFNVLRQHGLVGAAARDARAGRGVGRYECQPAAARPLTPDEVREFAETCVAMLEVHGQSIDVTLSELSVEAGGVLLPDDAPKVRELAEALAYGGEGSRRNGG